MIKAHAKEINRIKPEMKTNEEVMIARHTRNLIHSKKK